ncbi:VWA domain-containing protein [Nocardia goodfellowii]|uniref:Ca-activated chloride channel family protein n=1 Tax=Nocardia goodfellowii TaxID=882446 RepID=A0ABS4QGQ1_9NOCA|nr:VWA domain-containing protein [Nocardia goodfellowii]MBP2190862.1 Ca-activated chloride channel family protein [Nocardia goodfellowii]
MSISHFTALIWLGFLAVIALILLGYVLVQRSRHKRMLTFSNMELLEKVAPARPSPARHVPIALMLVGLVLLTIAAAGPTAVKKVARNRATVMLVMDVSLSMQATDVQPSRLQVAQKAGKEFVDGLPQGLNIGFITFAGTASVMVSPTVDHEAVKVAIDNVRLAERTATGEGILTAIQAIETLGTVLGGGSEPPPARIVLMSDGKQTVPSFEDVDNPRHEFVAARLAKAKNIPISTISFGTDWGAVEIPREGGGQDEVKVPVDNEAMREVAKLSGGEFYTASSLQDLTRVYDTLEEQIGFELTRGDASRPWLLFGLLITSAGVITGLLLRQRLP